MLNKKKEVSKVLNEKKLVVLKPAKDFDQREMAGCGLAALVIKVPVLACK